LFIFQTSSKRFEMRVNSLIILLLVVLLLFCLTLTEAKSKSVDPEGWSVTGNVGGNTRGGGVNWNVGATYSWDDSEQRYRYNGPDISRRSKWRTWTQSEEEPADPEGWSVGANVGGNTRGGGINWSVGATYSWDDSEQRYRYNGPDISRRLKWRPSALSEEEPADPEGWSVTGNVGGNTRGGGVNWNVGATYSWDDSEQRYRYGDKRDYGIQKGPVYQTRPYFPGRKGAVFPRVMSDSKNKFNPGYIQPVRW
jgi:hypothetical protein